MHRRRSVSFRSPRSDASDLRAEPMGTPIVSRRISEGMPPQSFPTFSRPRLEVSVWGKKYLFQVLAQPLRELVHDILSSVLVFADAKENRTGWTKMAWKVPHGMTI
jgi:hypothetical protein